jgi:hypothetical protein
MKGCLQQDNAIIVFIVMVIMKMIAKQRDFGY